MHFGLGVLRLAPENFWAMTPRELLAAAGTRADLQAPTHQELQSLMKRYPDSNLETAR